jgi:hypothetical protein
VPATAIVLPIRRARDIPTMPSNGEPLETRLFI